MSYSWRTDATFVEDEDGNAFYITTPQENVLLEFNSTPLLTDGDPPASVVALLYITPTQQFTLLDDPTSAGPWIYQRLRGLAAGDRYLLRLSFETGGNTISMSLLVFCNV